MNLLNIFQMMQGGNPQAIAMQILNSNPQIANNPMVKNIFNMAKDGDIHGIEQMGRNMAKEKGIDFDKSFSDFKNQFHL